MNNHDRLLLRYINALENGDFAVMAEIWRMAENDSRLTQDLHELNQEMGETSMSLQSSSKRNYQLFPTQQISRANGHTASATPLQEPDLFPAQALAPSRRTRSFSMTRIAAVLLFALGGLGLMWMLQPRPDPLQTVPIFGSTPTSVAQEGLMPITVENADQLVEVNRMGEGAVVGGMWSPDGQKLVTYGTYIWVYDASNLAEPVNVIDPEFYADFAIFGDDSDSLVVGAVDGRARVVDLQTGDTQELPKLNTTYLPMPVIARSGNLIARAQNDPALISVWDIEQGREVFVFYDFDEKITQLAFSADGTILSAAGTIYPSRYTIPQNATLGEYQIQLWDTTTGEHLQTLDIEESNLFTSLVISPDNTQVIASTVEYVYRWDLLEAPNSLPTTIAESSDVVNKLIYDENDQEIITFTNSYGFLLAFEVETLTPVTFLDYSKIETDGFRRTLAISPDYSMVLVTSNHGSLWVVDTNNSTSTWLQEGFYNHYLSVDIRYPYVLYSNMFNVVVADMTTNEVVATWRPEFSGISDAVFIADDRIAIYGDSSFSFELGNEFIVWNFQTDEQDSLKAQDIIGWAFSPDQKQGTLINNWGQFFQFDTQTEEIVAGLLLPKKLGGVDAKLVYQPNTSYLAMGDGTRQIQIFDVSDSTNTEPIAVLSGNTTRVMDMVFNTSGNVLFSLDWAGNLIKWDTATWQEVSYAGLGHQNFSVMAISPDNSVLVSAGDDQLYVLEADTLAVLHVYDIDNYVIADMQFTADGTQVITASNDGTIHFWGIPTE